MATCKNPTPLTLVLRACTPDERERLADMAGTDVSYLYQLAGCGRGTVPRADKALAISDAIEALHKESGGRIPLCDYRTLATMCVLQGL